MPSARPDYLEDFLVSLIREFRGVYAPDSEWVKSTVDYFEDDLRRYLGTYFPRSFSKPTRLPSNSSGRRSAPASRPTAN